MALLKQATDLIKRPKIVSNKEDFGSDYNQYLTGHKPNYHRSQFLQKRLQPLNK